MFELLYLSEEFQQNNVSFEGFPFSAFDAQGYW